MFLQKLIFTLFYLLDQKICLEITVQDCWTADYDILFAYDCRKRETFAFQYEMYSDLQAYFSPNKGLRFSLGVFGVDGIKVIKHFNETFLDILSVMEKEDDCPIDLSVHDIFDTTRDVFQNANRGAKKLSLVILYKEADGLQIDQRFTEQIDFLQDQDVEILRLFIILDKEALYFKKNNFLSINPDNFYIGDVIGTVCNICRPDSYSDIRSDQNHKKCYLIGNSSFRGTRSEAESKCGRVFKMITIISNEEYNYLKSAIITKLEKLHISNALTFVNFFKYWRITITGQSQRPDKFNSLKYNVNLSSAWSFKYTSYLNTTLNDQTNMSSRSIIENENKYTDQILELNLNEHIENIPLCEIDLTTKTNDVSLLELSYQTVEIGENTLIPKDYMLSIIREYLDIPTYFKNISYKLVSSLNVKKINCLVSNVSGSICQHKHMCHSDYEYRRSYCDGPVQYIYKNRLVSDNFNYIAVNKSGLTMDLRNLNNSNSSHKGFKIIQPNKDMYSNKSLKFKDWPPTEGNEVIECIRVDKNWNATTTVDFYISKTKPKLWRQKYDILNTNETCLNCIISETVYLFLDSTKKNCSSLVCPANFLKCPNSECLFLGDTFLSKTRCEIHGYKNLPYSGSLICTVDLKSALKRTCTNINFSDYIKDFYMEMECDFVCAEGFNCLFGNIKNITGNESSHVFNLLHQSVGIYKISDKYKIAAQKIALFSLVDHLELRAPGCYIEDMHKYLRELDISHVIILDLSFNNLTSKDIKIICSMKLLRYLNVSHNHNLTFPYRSILPNLLETIDMSYTNVNIFPLDAFEKLVKLKYLNLRQTKIRDFYSIRLPPFSSLNIIDLRETNLHDVSSDMFQGLSIQSALFVDDYKLCCPQVTGPNIPQDKCYAPQGPLLSSCKDLIGDSNKRIILWFVGILAFTGNTFVVVYRLIWDKEMVRKAYGLFVICLGVSDLTMGIYLIVIAAADSSFRSLYVLNETRWRYGIICKFAGFLATFSSESSAFFICLITIDRYLIMRYPFGEYRFTKLAKVNAVVFTWLISFILALIPTLPLDWDIYSSNSMCLALPLNNVAYKGWLYSFCVLIIINFLTFLFIFIGQVSVFIWFNKNKMPMKSMIANNRSNDVSIAKNLAFVAVSDFVCWFPIAIMGFMSLGGYMFGNEAYSWSAVFVIPINSALNPIIYTLPAVTRKLRNTH